MRVAIPYGLDHLELEVDPDRLVEIRRRPVAAPLTDPAAALGEALENPLGFPPLRRALTPDDQITVVVDERLPHLGRLLVPLLRHLGQAHIAPEAVTVLCPNAGGGQTWVDELPEEYEEVRVEVHDPGDRNNLSYLATTRQGRRLYLNRSAVTADQLVVLAGRGYDPLLGYSGAEAALFPALADAATRQEFSVKPSLEPPGAEPWPIRQEAAEVVWLLGAPFLIQVIPGSGEEVTHVVAGLLDTSAEGVRLLDARWRVEADRRADLVVASVTGNPAHHDFLDLARALGSAARVVNPGGRIVLLSGGQPSFDAAAGVLRQAENPAVVLKALRQPQSFDTTLPFLWASAARQANLYLLSRLADEEVEDLFCTSLAGPAEVQRLADQAGSCLVLPDAHRTLAVVPATE